MPYTIEGPNPSNLRQKKVFKIAAKAKNYKSREKVLLVLRKSENGEKGGGWGVYTPKGRGIIIKKGDIVTSFVGYESCRGVKETSKTHSAPTGGNYGISDGQQIRDALVASIPPGVTEVEFTASTAIHLQKVKSTLSPQQTGDFVVTWNMLGCFIDSSRGSSDSSSISNVTKPLPRRAAYVCAIKLPTRQEAREEKARKIKEKEVDEVVVAVEGQKQRLSKRLINNKTDKKATSKKTTTSPSTCLLEDFVIKMPMLARRDIRGNEQLLWDYPWRPSEEEEEEEEEELED